MAWRWSDGMEGWGDPQPGRSWSALSATHSKAAPGRGHRGLGREPIPGGRDLGWEPQWCRRVAASPREGRVDQKPHDPLPAGGAC